MGRSPRLQFNGAIYHVFSRGNYRRDLFETEGATLAFETCLFEACRESGWLLHAYILMRNHFHLALETPRANLSRGMHWLQSTYSKRFNRYRRELGHLFQSRFKALLVEPGRSLSGLVNYIHLNPVRAHILPAADLGQFRWSSYWRFRSASRPSFLTCRDWMREIPGISDSAEGWREYHHYLVWLAADEAEQKRQAFATLMSGWAIGSEAWRQDIAADQRRRLGNLAFEQNGDRELKELGWAEVLSELLAKEGRNRTEGLTAKKGAAWKVLLARQLRCQTSATNLWIAQNLHMGSPKSVSVYLSRENGRINN